MKYLYLKVKILALTFSPVVSILLIGIGLHYGIYTSGMTAVVFGAYSVVATLLIIPRVLSKGRYCLSLKEWMIVLLLIFILFRILIDDFENNRQLTSAYAVYFLCGCLIPYLVATAFDFDLESDRLSHGIHKVIFVTVIFLIYSNARFYSEGKITRIGGDDQLLNPLQVGYLSSGLIGLSFWSLRALLRKVRRPKTFNLIFIFASAIAGLTALFLSASKGALLSVLTLYLLFLSACIFKKNYKFFIFNAFLVITAVGSLVYGNVPLGEWLVLAERLQDDSSALSRVALLSEAFHVFKSSWLVGASGALPSGGFAHNIIVEGFVQLGLFGGFMFFLLNIIAVQRSVILILRDCNSSWAGYLFVNFLIAALFSGALHLSFGYWVFLALVLQRGKRSNTVTVDR